LLSMMSFFLRPLSNKTCIPHHQKRKKKKIPKKGMLRL
jgi:hypothetical protein